MQIPFVGPAYSVRSSNLDAQRTVNLYPVMDETGEGKSVKALYGCPGTRLLVTLPGSGGIRAAYRPASGDAIVVQGASVYRVNAAWSYTLVGSLNTSTGVVSIKDNGTTAVLVDGNNGYTLNLASNAFAQISDPAFYGADYVDFLDSYLIFNKPNTFQFYISGQYDVTFDALDFASVEGSAEPIVRHIVDHREIWFFKRTSTSIYVDSGGADFPFSRTQTSIEVGCAAPASVCKLDNSLVWLGQDSTGSTMVWRANGYTPTRISTEAIDHAIQGYSAVEDAFAYTYQQEGHAFYVLTFPTANATWVFDAFTGQWHERAWRDPADGSLNRHRSNCHMYFDGEHVVGDFENGNLYALDLDYFSDNGDPLPAIRAAGHVSNPDYLWMIFDALQVDMETGVGLQSGQGSEPNAVLEWSDDGGHTWGNQHQTSMGSVGKYRTRARWTRMGRSRDRIFRLTISDPVKRVILGASAKVRICAS